jgi:hypothetical protein
MTRTKVPVVDLRSELLKEKKKHQVYYKTDTHWNHYGANVGQYEIMKKIDQLFPSKVNPKFYTENSFVMKHKNDGDLCKYAKMEPRLEVSPQLNIALDYTRNDIEEHDRYFETTKANKQLTGLFFRDSFFEYLQPYVSLQFKKATFIWDMLNFEKLNLYLQSNQPDVVVEEWVERTLPYIPEPVSK